MVNKIFFSLFRLSFLPFLFLFTNVFAYITTRIMQAGLVPHLDTILRRSDRRCTAEVNMQPLVIPRQTAALRNVNGASCD